MWRTIQKTLATTVPPLLLLGYLAVAICLLNRWDAMVMVTLVPVWLWAGVGALIALLCWIICRGVLPGVLFCLFLITGIGFSEEAFGIVRELIISLKKTPAEAPAGKILRIVNVRCGGEEASLRKAAESSPDVLIVQEAPDKTILEAVADQLYGVERSVTLIGKKAILGRGEALAVIGDPESPALHVRLKRPDGLVLDVSNLDLPGCRPRIDMWRPDKWSGLITARIENRRLVRTHLGEHPVNRQSIGRVIGGGFGTPPGDDVFRPLENSGMLDTYAEVGTGWGNTYPSDYPLLRLDQVWVSPNLKPRQSTTRLNAAGKNRIVVSEVEPAAR
ncbi:MAG: hypothetical protein QE273_01815 [Verrucomicrobiales bacterium]|jgi:hypothetical protein|nr:hypothetical protein [Verrucomicrobiales bacterium]